MGTAALLREGVRDAVGGFGNWPPASFRGRVGKVVDQLKREVFQELIQNKVEDVGAGARSDFSPSGGPQGTICTCPQLG